MKKLVYMLLLTALVVITGCKDAGISVPDATTVDAATEAKIKSVTGTVLDVADNALNAAQSGVSQGSGARTVISDSIPSTTVTAGVSVSGDYSYDTSTEVYEYNLDIAFSNYSDGTTALDGKVGYEYILDLSDDATEYLATMSGDLKATVDGVIYNLEYKITTRIDIKTFAVTVDGWIRTDDGFVVYNNESVSF